MNNKLDKLIDLLNENNYGKDVQKFKLVLKLFKDVELLLPFNDNHVIFLTTDEEKNYIPLFTNEIEIKDIKYTRVDKVKLEIVIRDIYNRGNYYAISINPFTHDFIMNKKLIELFNILV